VKKVLYNPTKKEYIKYRKENRRCLLVQEIQAVFANLEQEIKDLTKDCVRHFPLFPIGKKCRQGDIYIHRVEDNHPHGGIQESHQLAFGSSRGSRHIADESFIVYKGTTLPGKVAPGTFLGPCITTETGGMIKHPEHGWCEIPAGTYQVTHQTDLKTRQRALD